MSPTDRLAELEELRDTMIAERRELDVILERYQRLRRRKGEHICALNMQIRDLKDRTRV